MSSNSMMPSSTWSASSASSFTGSLLDLSVQVPLGSPSSLQLYPGLRRLRMREFDCLLLSVPLVPEDPPRILDISQSLPRVMKGTVLPGLTAVPMTICPSRSAPASYRCGLPPSCVGWPTSGSATALCRRQPAESAQVCLRLLVNTWQFPFQFHKAFERL